jgi:hypothetical protein
MVSFAPSSTSRLNVNAGFARCTSAEILSAGVCFSAAALLVRFQLMPARFRFDCQSYELRALLFIFGMLRMWSRQQI